VRERRRSQEQARAAALTTAAALAALSPKLQATPRQRFHLTPDTIFASKSV
jgi:hypothetical protein